MERFKHGNGSPNRERKRTGRRTETARRQPRRAIAWQHWQSS